MISIENRLRQYLSERFGKYSDDIGLDDSLEDTVDSMGIFDLVAFLEEEFSVSIPNHEFTPRRFATVGGIIKVIDEFRTN